MPSNGTPDVLPCGFEQVGPDFDGQIITVGCGRPATAMVIDYLPDPDPLSNPTGDPDEWVYVYAPYCEGHIVEAVHDQRQSTGDSDHWWVAELTNIHYQAKPPKE